MAERKPWMRHALGAACIAFSAITRRLPLPLAAALGSALGTLGYLVIPRLRSGAIDNLSLAYRDALSPAAKRRIARRAAQHLGIVGAQFSRVPSIDTTFVERHVRIEGREHLDGVEGVILIGAHIGNWEWMAPVIRTFRDKAAEVVRPLDDSALAAYVDDTRRGNGVVTVPKAGAGRELVRMVRDGYLVGILVDQSPRENAVPVRFFDQPCWATIAPVMVAFRTHAPVMPISMTRDPDGDYTLRIGAPIELTRTGRLRPDILENSQRCQDAIEQLVRAHPEQWLWAHRRWKARPQLEAEWQARVARDHDPAPG